MLRRFTIDFLREEDGQSLVEYTILMAWICLASVAVIHGISTAEQGVWRVTNSQLASAKTTAS
jgi:Flp pilus assembly pilin Flp